MNPLARLLKRIDDNLAAVLDRHLALAIPEQRSISPESVIRGHLRPRDIEPIGSFPCCACCAASGRICVDIHRTPCDEGPDCAQNDGAA